MSMRAKRKRDNTPRVAIRSKTTRVESASSINISIAELGRDLSRALKIGANRSCDTGVPILRTKNANKNTVTVMGNAIIAPVRR